MHHEKVHACQKLCFQSSLKINIRCTIFTMQRLMVVDEKRPHEPLKYCCKALVPEV